MDQIPVKKAELLKKLENNLRKHRKDFSAALEEWETQATEALGKAYHTAAEGEGIDLNPLKDLPKPSSYTESYKNAIERVKWFEGEIIELDDHEFASWVQDNWNWKGAFLSNTTQYSMARV